MADGLDLSLTIAGPGDVKDFWSAMERLKELNPKILQVPESHELIAELNNTIPHPLVLVLSTRIAERMEVASLRQIRFGGDTEIIVAGAIRIPDGEQRIRAAGVACYVTLPDEADALFEQTVYLLNACRERMERLPPHMRHGHAARERDASRHCG